MIMPTFYDALKALIGEGKTGGGSTDGPISEIIFLDGVTKPTDAEVNAKLAELQATYDAQAYARSRKAEYPPWEEQLDHIYHNGVASWKANMVKPVKDKYPKP